MIKQVISLIFVLSLALFLQACATQAGTDRSARIGQTQPDPDKAAKLNMELGVAYMNEQENEKALRKLQKALQIDPNYVDAHNAIAVLYARLGENALAEKHYSRAVKLAPNDSLALNNYGQFLCAQAQSDKADEMFQRALANPLYRTPHVAYLNAGVCARSVQQYDKAETYFREALKRNARMPAALYQMADISFEQKRYDVAQSYLARFADVTQHTPASLWLAVQVERALGDRDAAASFGLLLKNRFPDAQETRLYLKSKG